MRSSVFSNLNICHLKLYIKFMVSIRCKLLVKDILKRMGLHYSNVVLGEAEVLEHISDEQRVALKTELAKSGLELMDDKRSILIEKIKNIIIEMIHYSDEIPRETYSEYISKKLNYDYTYLSNLFSEVRELPYNNLLLSIKLSG